MHSAFASGRKEQVARRCPQWSCTPCALAPTVRGGIQLRRISCPDSVEVIPGMARLPAGASDVLSWMLRVRFSKGDESRRPTPRSAIR